MKDFLIELKNISFFYDKERHILNSLNLKLKRGERIGLMGSNGSGKTTLLHIIVGLLTPSDGEVILFGKIRKRESDFEDVRTKIGLLFQDPDDQLFSPTVIEDVAFGPLNLGKSREEAIRIAIKTLSSLGLTGYEDRITYKLSGGEKRLVSLATVLAMNPEVLLLDEPTSGLDKRNEKRIIEILSHLPQSMIVVSHEIDFLKKTTGSILELREGQILPLSENYDSEENIVEYPQPKVSSLIK